MERTLLLDPLPCRERVHVEAAMRRASRTWWPRGARPGARTAPRGTGFGTATRPLSSTACSEVAPEHPTRRGGLPHVPRLHHLTPHRPTARRDVHPRGSHCQGNFSGCANERRTAAARAARRRRSVSRILSPRPGSGGSSHSSGPPVARGIERPTRGERAGHPRPARRPGLPPTRSCSGWGLPSVRPHERTWRALTSPFHPCPGPTPEAVCSLWHFPPVARGRR